MRIRHTARQVILFIVDCFILCISLILAFSLRNGQLKTLEEINQIFLPSSLIILSSITVFFIYGLYDKPTLKLTRELGSRIITSQIISGIFAIIFFYNLPFLGAAPKTILVIYLFLSSILSFLWRKYAYNLILLRKQQIGVIIGSGKSFMLLADEFSRNPHLGISLVAIIDLDTYDLSKIASTISHLNPDSIIVDLRDNRLQDHLGTLYNELFHNVSILDIVDVYRDVYEGVPLDVINQEWILRHIDVSRRYDSVKRVVDVIVTLPAFIISLIVYPFVYIAIKLEDGGPMFFSQIRIGRHGEPFTIYKLRSMEHKPANELNETKKITRVGAFLRKTRIDEFPQFWNVLRGDLSFVGPRPESPALVEEYNKSIKYYPMRHLVRPGLTGLAQIEQHEVPKFGIDINQTSTKLSYDLHYIASGNVFYDLSIILKTIKVFLSKVGV